MEFLVETRVAGAAGAVMRGPREVVVAKATRGVRWTLSQIIGQVVVVKTHLVQFCINLPPWHLSSKNPFHDLHLSRTKGGRR